LREKLESYESRILELENSMAAFKRDQSEIEQGIVSALNQLDELEDETVESSHTVSSPDAMTGASRSEQLSPTEDSAENELSKDGASKEESSENVAGADTDMTSESATPPDTEEKDADSDGDESQDLAERRKEPGELDIF